MTPETATDHVRNRLLGGWSLVSWEISDSAGHTTYPLGRDAIGQLLYDAQGRVSAQLARPDRSKFNDDDWQKASTEEKATAWGNYFGYFGSFTIDEPAHTVVHHIEGSWFPNLVGTEQRRVYHFEGDRLILNASTAWGEVRIVWNKA
jgi:Lipocalin-like domain